MKKSLIVFCIIGVINQCLFSQGVVDVPPRKQQDIQAAEGGGQHVAIDTNTPLPKLIQRLEREWHEVKTRKGYWIGYTNDMYSIAAHGDGAIDSLLKFIEKTKSDRAKYGTILTLHLIGIERKIAGRWIEDFQNHKARNALLSLLSNEDIQVQVLTLLIRDPWPSDVPHLFKILEGETPNAWAIVKALQRYKIKKRPIHQALPKELRALPCECNYKSKDECHSRLMQALLRSAGEKLVVEDKLIDSNLWGDAVSGEGYIGGGFSNVLDGLTGCDYISLNNKIEYYTENDRVHICGIKTARKRWLEWWKEVAAARENGPC